LKSRFALLILQHFVKRTLPSLLIVEKLLIFIGPAKEDMLKNPFALPKAPPTQAAAMPSKAARNLLTGHPEGSSHPPAKQGDLPRVPGLVHWPILYVPSLQPQRLPRCWRSTQILQLLLTRPRASPSTSLKLESL
jgi:hypothetical protein